VNYNDKVFLKTNTPGVNRWLSGGLYTSNEAVKSFDFFDNDDVSSSSYQWTVRSIDGTGDKDAVDPYIGSCLAYGDTMILQVNNVNSRWLTGGRGGENNLVITRDKLQSDYEKILASKSYEWIVRSTDGSGDRDFVDPNKGSCIGYGDKIILQNNNFNYRWLTGARGGGNNGVYTRDKRNDNEMREHVTYEWIIMGTAGDGSHN
jgi:hypothetical protein